MLTQLSFPFSLCEDADDIGQARKVDAAARFHSFDTQCRCEMALAGSKRSQAVDHLVPFDEVELGQCKNPVTIERGLAGKRLDGRELGHSQRHLDPSVLAQGEFLGKQGSPPAHFPRAEVPSSARGLDAIADRF